MKRCWGVYHYELGTFCVEEEMYDIVECEYRREECGGLRWSRHCDCKNDV
jgi:hypothetical protein